MLFYQYNEPAIHRDRLSFIRVVGLFGAKRPLRSRECDLVLLGDQLFHVCVPFLLETIILYTSTTTKVAKV